MKKITPEVSIDLKKNRSITLKKNLELDGYEVEDKYINDPNTEYDILVISSKSKLGIKIVSSLAKEPLVEFGDDFNIMPVTEYDLLHNMPNIHNEIKKDLE